MDPLQHPDYLAAVAAERAVRDAAFLPVTESIAGFEVQPLRLWHVLTLRLMQSPLLGNGTPTPVELASFLWLVSVEYQQDNPRLRQKFLRRCQPFLPLAPPVFGRRSKRWHRRAAARLLAAVEVINDARKYIKAAFADAPPGAGGHQTEYFSNAATFCALLWRDYGIPADRALDLPVRQYLQFRRRSEKTGNPRAIQRNTSDEVLARLMAALNAQNAAPGSCLLRNEGEQSPPDNASREQTKPTPEFPPIANDAPQEANPS